MARQHHVKNPLSKKEEDHVLGHFYAPVHENVSVPITTPKKVKQEHIVVKRIGPSDRRELERLFMAMEDNNG